MDSVLIVSSTEKGTSFFMELLNQNLYKEIATVKSCGEARQLLIERDFDLCIINAPLIDEFGESFALHIISKGISQVMLVVRCEMFDEISAKVEEYGVFTVSKPLNKQIVWSALKLANAAYNKMNLLKKENGKLLKRIEDIRLVDRAKCILIQYLKMTEPEAHKFIEKQAMDMRITKKQVAEGILKTYES